MAVEYDYEYWLKTKYPYLSNDNVEDIVAKAKMFYYNIVYKADPTANETTHPIVGIRNTTWVKSACDDIVLRYGINNAIGYKENGVSIDFGNAEISTTLINMLAPIAGVI